MNDLAAVSLHRSSARADINFPVGLRPISVPGYDAGEFQALVREDTGRVLAVHGRGYRLVRNAEVFPAFDEALRSSELDRSEMTVTDEVSHGGARTVRTYRFPAHRLEVALGDSIDLRLKVVNSYDGSCAFSTVVGAYRLVCSNGLIVGQKFAQTYARHTQGLTIEETVKKLNGVITLYLDSAARWRRWTARRITDEEAREVLASLPEMNERLLGKLVEYWQREVKHIGPTVWALFNAATYWSTHEKVRSASAANRAAIVLEREQRVRRMLGGATFLKLAA